ncbi:hypothetical protein PCE1_002798 [Barthelona sp. PCE]
MSIAFSTLIEQEIGSADFLQNLYTTSRLFSQMDSSTSQFQGESVKGTVFEGISLGILQQFCNKLFECILYGLSDLNTEEERETYVLHPMMILNTSFEIVSFRKFYFSVFSDEEIILRYQQVLGVLMVFPINVENLTVINSVLGLVLHMHGLNISSKLADFKVMHLLPYHLLTSFEFFEPFHEKQKQTDDVEEIFEFLIEEIIHNVVVRESVPVAFDFTVILQAFIHFVEHMENLETEILGYKVLLKNLILLVDDMLFIKANIVMLGVEINLLQEVQSILLKNGFFELLTTKIIPMSYVLYEKIKKKDVVLNHSNLLEFNQYLYYLTHLSIKIIRMSKDYQVFLMNYQELDLVFSFFGCLFELKQIKHIGEYVAKVNYAIQSLWRLDHERIFGFLIDRSKKFMLFKSFLLSAFFPSLFKSGKKNTAKHVENDDFLNLIKFVVDQEENDEFHKYLCDLSSLSAYIASLFGSKYDSDHLHTKFVEIINYLTDYISTAELQKIHCISRSIYLLYSLFTHDKQHFFDLVSIKDVLHSLQRYVLLHSSHFTLEVFAEAPFVKSKCGVAPFTAPSSLLSVSTQHHLFNINVVRDQCIAFMCDIFTTHNSVVFFIGDESLFDEVIEIIALTPNSHHISHYVWPLIFLCYFAISVRTSNESAIVCVPLLTKLCTRLMSSSHTSIVLYAAYLLTFLLQKYPEIMKFWSIPLSGIQASSNGTLDSLLYILHVLNGADVSELALSTNEDLNFIALIFSDFCGLIRKNAVLSKFARCLSDFSEGKLCRKQFFGSVSSEAYDLDNLFKKLWKTPIVMSTVFLSRVLNTLMFSDIVMDLDCVLDGWLTLGSKLDCIGMTSHADRDAYIIMERITCVTILRQDSSKIDDTVRRISVILPLVTDFVRGYVYNALIKCTLRFPYMHGVHHLPVSVESDTKNSATCVLLVNFMLDTNHVSIRCSDRNNDLFELKIDQSFMSTPRKINDSDASSAIGTGGSSINVELLQLEKLHQATKGYTCSLHLSQLDYVKNLPLNNIFFPGTVTFIAFSITRDSLVFFINDDIIRVPEFQSSKLQDVSVYVDGYCVDSNHNDMILSEIVLGEYVSDENLYCHARNVIVNVAPNGIASSIWSIKAQLLKLPLCVEVFMLLNSVLHNLPEYWSVDRVPSFSMRDLKALFDVVNQFNRYSEEDSRGKHQIVTRCDYFCLYLAYSFSVIHRNFVMFKERDIAIGSTEDSISGLILANFISLLAKETNVRILHINMLMSCGMHDDSGHFNKWLLRRPDICQNFFFLLNTAMSLEDLHKSGLYEVLRSTLHELSSLPDFTLFPDPSLDLFLQFLCDDQFVSLVKPNLSYIVEHCALRTSIVFNSMIGLLCYHGTNSLETETLKVLDGLLAIILGRMVNGDVISMDTVQTLYNAAGPDSLLKIPILKCVIVCIPFMTDPTMFNTGEVLQLMDDLHGKLLYSGWLKDQAVVEDVLTTYRLSALLVSPDDAEDMKRMLRVKRLFMRSGDSLVKTFAPFNEEIHDAYVADFCFLIFNVFQGSFSGAFGSGWFGKLGLIDILDLTIDRILKTDELTLSLTKEPVIKHVDNLLRLLADNVVLYKDDIRFLEVVVDKTEELLLTRFVAICMPENIRISFTEMLYFFFSQVDHNTIQILIDSLQDLKAFSWQLAIAMMPVEFAVLAIRLCMLAPSCNTFRLMVQQAFSHLQTVKTLSKVIDEEFFSVIISNAHDEEFFRTLPDSEVYPDLKILIKQVLDTVDRKATETERLNKRRVQQDCDRVLHHLTYFDQLVNKASQK